MLNNDSLKSPTHESNNPAGDHTRPNLGILKEISSSSSNYLPEAITNALYQALKVGTFPEVTESNARQLLESVAIDPNANIQAPQVCLEILQSSGNSVFGTLGNISMIIGKAKSRKTFLITAYLAAAVIRGTVLNRLYGSLPKNQRQVLFFDSEQGTYHVQKVVRRVLGLSGKAQLNNFRAYALRRFKPSDRLKMIESAIYDTPELGLVVIDGIRDLVSSINDEEQATMISSKLLKWSEEKNIHIICVLHQNKGDNNARGHLGSELQNKAESVLSVTKSTDNKEISIVAPEYCREREFEPFAFGIDENGLPYLKENWTAKPDGGQIKKVSSPGDIAIEKHREIAKMAFKNNPKPKLSDLIIQLKLALKAYGFPMGDNRAKEFKVWYENEGLIEQKGISGTKASYYILNEQV